MKKSILGVFGLSLLLAACNELTLTAPNSVTLSSSRVLKVETAADGTGSVLSARTLTYGTTVTAYAVLRDGNGTFVSNPSVTWSLSSAIGTLSATTGTSVVLTPTTASGTATLSATADSRTGSSGTLTASFTPTNISGISLWLDAGSTAMTALSLADADPVVLWPDSSGAGNPANQAATAANRPTYRTAVANSRPVVRFDGANDVLTLKTALNMQAGTFVVVGLPAGGNTGPYLGSSATANVQFGYDNAGNAQATDGTTPHVAVRAAPAAFEILTLTSAGAGLSTDLWANGTVSLIAGVTPTWAVTFDQIGSTNTAGAYTGDIAEVIAYSSALSTTDLAALHSYLSTKYNITLGL